jgi:hypothetical protein
MLCHVCEKPAVGQCMECWRFYCAVHGVGSRCSICIQKKEDARREAERLMEAFRRGEKPHGAIVGDYGRSTQLSESERQRLDQVDMEGTLLRRVIPIAQTVPWGDQVVTFLSLEIYADGSILQYSTLRNWEPGIRSHSQTEVLAYLHESNPPFRLEDDQGTKYHVLQFGGGGGGAIWRGSRRIMPAIPDTATLLRLYMRQALQGPSGQTSGAETEIRLSLRP